MGNTKGSVNRDSPSGDCADLGPEGIQFRTLEPCLKGRVSVPAAPWVLSDDRDAGSRCSAPSHPGRFPSRLLRAPRRLPGPSELLSSRGRRAKARRQGSSEVRPERGKSPGTGRPGVPRGRSVRHLRAPFLEGQGRHFLRRGFLGRRVTPPPPPPSPCPSRPKRQGLPERREKVPLDRSKEKSACPPSPWWSSG